MSIINFNIVAITTIILWVIGLILFYSPKKISSQHIIANVFVLSGIVILAIYLSYLWMLLEHAPMRTSGHTRLWYSLFLSCIGMVIYYKWRMMWVPVFSIFMSILFLVLNIIYPENFNKSLMPALQSIWFVPHVIVYIFAYSMLAASSLIALKGLYLVWKGISNDIEKRLITSLLVMADNIVFIAFAFLTFGLLFGALWAKEAWGSYWTWDPKEVWAFVTWLLYLLYIHFRFQHKNKVVLPLWLLLISFFILLVCWFGINYLPAAQVSVHTYRT